VLGMSSPFDILAQLTSLCVIRANIQVNISLFLESYVMLNKWFLM